MRHSVWKRMRRTASSNDVGASLISVLGVAVVLSLLIMTATMMVARQTIKSRQTQDWSAARSAALSGAQDFATRVADQGQGYITTFSQDTSNPAVDTNPTTSECDGSGQLIRATGGTQTRFCYRLLSHDVATGKVILEVTGLAGVGDKQEESKLTVEYGMGGGDALTRYSWFTDFGLTDPQLVGTTDPNCIDKYAWDGRPSSCPSTIIRGRTLDGRYHSNDWWEIDGNVTFNSGPITNAGPPPFFKPYNGGTGQLLGTPVTRVSLMKLPQHTGDLLKHVLPKHDTDPNTNRPGCLYEGQTKIVLNGSTMSVTSPNTSSVGPGCPSHGSTGAIPPIIYVKRASNTATCSTNRAAGFYNPSEVVRSGKPGINYDGCNGTLAVEGNVNGASVTMYAEEDAVITDDLTVSNTSSNDLMGVVAGGYVWIHNPITSLSPVSFVKPSGDRTIHASLSSLNHTVVVQNYWEGPPRGKIVSLGSALMKYEALYGTLSGGVLSGGYTGQHAYDERLGANSPPYFIKSTTSQFGIVSVSEGGSR